MDRFYCNVCDKRIDSDFNFTQHLQSRDHRRKFNNQQAASLPATTVPKTVVTFDFDFPVKSYTNVIRNEPAPVIRPAQATPLVIRPPQPVAAQATPLVIRPPQPAAAIRPTQATPSVIRPSQPAPSIRAMDPMSAAGLLTIWNPQAFRAPTPTACPPVAQRPVPATACPPVAQRSWSSVVKSGLPTQSPNPEAVFTPVSPFSPLPQPSPVAAFPPATTQAATNPWTKVLGAPKRHFNQSQDSSQSSLHQSQVSTQLSSQPAAQTTTAVPQSTGWLKADKSIYHKKKMYTCDLCQYKCDSEWNLKTHRNSRRCRDARPESPILFNSPPLDPEPYIIRRKIARRVLESPSSQVSLTASRLSDFTITDEWDRDVVRPTQQKTGEEDHSIFNSPREVETTPDQETVLPTQDTAPLDVSSGEEDHSIFNLQREAEATPEQEVYSCRECEAEFGTVQALMQHAVSCRARDSDEDSEEEEPAQRQQVFNCGQCDSTFKDLFLLKVHRRGCHPDNMANIKELCKKFNCDDCSMKPGDGCFRGRFRSVIVTPAQRCITMEQFIAATRPGIEKTLEHCWIMESTQRCFVL